MEMYSLRHKRNIDRYKQMRWREMRPMHVTGPWGLVLVGGSATLPCMVKPTMFRREVIPKPKKSGFFVVFLCLFAMQSSDSGTMSPGSGHAAVHRHGLRRADGQRFRRRSPAVAQHHSGRGHHTAEFGHLPRPQADRPGPHVPAK